MGRRVLEYTDFAGDSVTAWKLREPDGDVGSWVEIKFTDSKTVKASYHFYNLYTDGVIALNVGSSQDDFDGYLVTLNTGAGHGFRMVFFFLDPKSNRIEVGLDTWSLIEGPNCTPPIAFDKLGNPVITQFDEGDTPAQRIMHKYAWAPKWQRFEVISSRVVTGSSADDGQKWDGRILGVRIGVDHRDKLERTLGPGRVQVGAHPESGREWTLANGLDVRVDGSYDSGSLLDTVVLSGWRGKLGDTRFRGKTLPLAPFAGLELGMSQAKVAEIVRPALGAPAVTKPELTWNVPGPHGWPSHVCADFSSGRLERLSFITEVNIHSKFTAQSAAGR